MSEIRMIDVGDKPVSKRRAVAVAHVTMGDEVRDRIVAGSLPKGDVLAVARVPGSWPQSARPTSCRCAIRCR
jgi:cyclic pyranopterin phosphate synthase